MSNIYTYKGKKLTINRFPKSSNKSLRSWNAADELAISYINEHKLPTNSVSLYNDRFGFFSCIFNSHKPEIVIDYKSQEKSIHQNLIANNLDFSFDDYIYPLTSIKESIDLSIIRIPKSLELFELHLQKISNQLSAEGTVICSFMTKYFSKQMIEIAESYFDSLEQTKAYKKGRLIILKSPKSSSNNNMNQLSFGEYSLKQYFGVFSSQHIDYATQFLIENLTIPSKAEMGLDLASGNGIIAHNIRQQNSHIELHLVDDMALAVESSKLNLTDSNTYFHFNNCLEEFQNNFFDFIVCNPPFHFEYETNIEVSLALFKDAKRCLKKDGFFQLVANKHLNYYTHLIKLFNKVEIINEQDKFIIYKCSK